MGMLIYWAHRISGEESFIVGMWYYSEIHVPSTIDEKMQSSNDLKKRRCLLVSIAGSFSQICDLLSQTDRFQNGTEADIEQFVTLTEQINSSSKAILFDDIQNLKGTSLALDTVITVEETLTEVQEQTHSAKQMITLRIAKDWSWARDITNSFEGR